MSLTKGKLRLLVTAFLVVTLAGVVVSIVGETSLPAPLREYLEVQSQRELSATDFVLVGIGIPLLIAVVLSIIGLYRFWPSARPLTVITFLVGLALQMFFVGPTVDTGLAIGLYELSAALEGMIIGVIYMTPAKEWFRKVPAEAPGD
jgi:hypothetical protein